MVGPGVRRQPVAKRRPWRSGGPGERRQPWRAAAALASGGPGERRPWRAAALASGGGPGERRRHLASGRAALGERRPWRASGGGPERAAGRPWRAAAALNERPSGPGERRGGPGERRRPWRAAAPTAKFAQRDPRLGSLAKPSPPATGSSGLQRHTAGSCRVQIPERLAERRRQTGFGASLSGVRPVLGQASGCRTESAVNAVNSRDRGWAEVLLSWTTCHVIEFHAVKGARSRAGHSNGIARRSTLGRREAHVRAMSPGCSERERC
jgi:hypothetical protein